MRSNKSSNSWPPKGLTLLEVVLSLALVGTLLTTSLMAFGRHARQVRRANLRREAVRAADQLLREWFGPAGHVPVAGEGRLGTDGSLVWRTETVVELGAESLAIDVVRLTIRAADAKPGDLALASVTVAAPREEGPLPNAPPDADP